ncbi:DUF2273 domain-containing protein [Oscillospiraceae bacterium HV4-5-C5C]|nr:DUF2273 domain-containing protein [Oscillospiraceae bacterium HV4-5-C5C]
MKQLFRPILDKLAGKDAGTVGALAGLILGLLLVIFGIWKTLFILLATVAGYIIGVKFFANSELFHQLLDRLFPPGRFR